MTWDTIWIIWGTVTLGTFGILEGIALYSKRKGDTLSETLRRWLGIDPPNRKRLIGVPAFIAAMVGFVTWFVPHIVLRWWWL